MRWAAADLDRASLGEHSLSGHEANRFFFNVGGKRFDDLSGLTGADHLGDGRSVVRWDYDHDGWPDLASVNANAPKLVWYRNRMGELLDACGESRRFLALRFQGGAGPSGGGSLSNRDGYGVRVRAEFGGGLLVRESRCGEGFSAQNSRTLLLGLGTAVEVDRLTVLWPGGKRQTAEKIAAGQLLIFREAPPRGEPDWVPAPY